MVRICPTCGFQNNDDSFWCENCKNKLIETNPEKKYVKIKQTKDSELIGYNNGHNAIVSFLK